LGAYLVSLALETRNGQVLFPWLWLMGGLVLLRGTMAWAESWLAHDLAYRILAGLRNKMYWALERLSPGYLLDQRSGNMAAAAMSDIEITEWFYAHTAGTFVVTVVVASSALVALVSIHWALMLVMLPFIILVIITPIWLRQRAEQQGRELRSRVGELNSEVVESVQGLREIVAFGQGQAQLEKLERQTGALLNIQLAHGKRAGLESAATNVLIALGMLSVLATAAWLTTQGALSPSLFPMSVILAAYTFGPITAVTGVARNFGIISAAAERAFDLIHKPGLVTDRVSQPPAGPVEAHLRFEQVSFRYGPDLPDALRTVSFEVTPGETVALVGHSGAGKSTCASLILRFWDVTEGAVTIGGYDLRDFPQSALRDLIALVPQDVYLFNTTLRENIRLGKPEASDEEVEQAARDALAHDFIVALPQGYETSAGERGLQLSGGQRQRIAIARALLKNSPLLVMDEAVSNLDTENERALQVAMARLRTGRTTLIIAHRLSTIRSADRIVCLDQGQVAEIGSHAELIAKGGVYARLVESQQSGIL
jgi:ABC-type multidrug transport system fused ATPase/permease subunit